MHSKFSKNYGSFRQYQPPKRRSGFFDFLFRGRQKSLSNRPILPAISAVPKHGYSKKLHTKDWRKIILLTLLAASAVAWILLMLYLPYFRIFKISFEGLNVIDRNEIENYIKQKYLSGIIIPSNNYFLVNTSKITDDLTQKYSVERVDVKKIFPGEIHIAIEEKITTIIYDNGKSYSILGDDGSVIKILYAYEQISDVPATSSAGSGATLPNTENLFSTSTATTTFSGETSHKPDWRKLAKNYYNLPIIYDTRKIDIWEKEINVLDAEVIRAVIDWETTLAREGIGEARYFETNNPSGGLTIYLNRPWKIFVNPHDPTAGQITNLKVILNSRDIKPLEYIDLRYGERVFWK